jgi:hypothetical protein
MFFQRQENQSFTLFLDNLNYIAINPSNITAKINAFTTFKSKNKYLKKTDSFLKDLKNIMYQEN